jgi:hypothetical protein
LKHVGHCSLIIHGRSGIRHGHHHPEAPRRSGPASRKDILPVYLAGIPKVGMQVNEGGSKEPPLPFENPGILA